jgi:hypothetical protein
MKVALCFIINYDHILNKENIWREWIESNKDIINVYFYYKDITKIKSKWIIKHTLPPKNIYETSYYHVIPAYLSLMKFALNHDKNNSWFCFLTDSCCPIISPKRFRYLFYKHYEKSIFSWKKAWWNVQFHKRANLALLPEEFHLANDPWFVMKREHVQQCFHFVHTQRELTTTICKGGLANESLFAIIMYAYKQLTTKNIISAVSHTTDWSRKTSPTSPHLFKDANELDKKFIEQSLEKDRYAMFIRKIAPEFHDDILRHYIYDYSKKADDELIVRIPLQFIYLKYICYLYYGAGIIVFLFVFRYMLL